jgi:hypothetical protein
LDKAPDAFRTISEVADDLDIPQHVLRFWETRFAQIKPMKRSGGRRYYRPDDVDLLRGIRRLLYGEGYTPRRASTSMTMITTARMASTFASPNPTMTKSRWRLKAAPLLTLLFRLARSTSRVCKACCRT